LQYLSLEKQQIPCAIKLAKENGAFIGGVCNVVGSSISRETHAGAYTHAGPEMVLHQLSFTTQITVLTMMALRLAKARELCLILISYVFARLEI
jgi:glucosamine 6-phosphate synthetase-like amidotransferase/phosphosugar isomerase protein